jgi:hypothetical protein
MCAEMVEYCDCCGNWVWLSGEPDDWEELGNMPSEQQLRTSYHWVDADPCIVEC